MKQLLLSFLLKDKFIGQLVAWITSAIGALAISFIPGAPEWIQVVIVHLLQLPEGVEITQAGIATALTPFILWIINALVQRVLVRDNNAVLTELKPAGYEGKIDGWVGPVAKSVIDGLIRK